MEEFLVCLQPFVRCSYFTLHFFIHLFFCITVDNWLTTQFRAAVVDCQKQWMMRAEMLRKFEE
jgi:hypothetical protein